MLGFPLGILSAAGAGGPIDAYELISTTVLGTATSSVSFSSLGSYSATYKHLQIRAVARDTRSQGSNAVGMRFNGDTGSNYSQHLLRGTGSGVISAASAPETILNPADISAALSTANAFGPFVIDLLDVFSTTKNTTMKSFSGQIDSFTYSQIWSGGYFSTAAIDSISLISRNSGSFATGSRFSLYGIKG